MDNNSNQIGTGIPAINDIPELPKVDLPAVDQNTAQVQQAQAIPTQPVPTQPVQTQPLPSTTYTYNYAPNANLYQAQPTVKAKKTGGQIAALVIGIILLVIFVPFSLILLLGDAVSGFEDPAMSVVVHGLFLLPNILGVILVVIGAKKKKTVVNPAVPVAQPYAAPVQTAPVAQTYAAPVQTAPVAQTYAAPVETAPVAQSYAVADQTVPVVTETQPASTPVVPETAAPVAESVPTAQPAVSETTQTSAPASYDYAPTQMIADDSKEAAKKSARSSALVSMAIVLGLWVVILVLLFGFNRWWCPWYLFLLTVIGPIGAIKTYPKSASAWFSLILSILSIVMFIFMTTQLEFV